MVRPYQKSDDQALISLLKLNIPKYFAPEELEDFIEYLDHKIEDYFVFMENGVLLGAGGINYLYDKKEARISWDFVHPDSQGKGIGRQITQYRLKKIRMTPNIDTIVVRTSQFANQYYEKMGFSLNRIEKDYWAK